MMSTKEIFLLEELRSTFLKLSEPVKNVSQSEKQWRDNIDRLKTLVLSDDPSSFLQWDVIKKTMDVGNADYIETELEFIRNLEDWTRWEKALKEVLPGRPTLYPNTKSSGNLIHHAYHVAQFEEKTGSNIASLDTIVEFGGGYGSMYRLVHNLGFRGKYVIFDFPAFSALQRYFIKSIGLDVHDENTFESSQNGVLCISDIEILQSILNSNKISYDNSMFLATWSISETPLNFRKLILELVTKFKSFLIAYQGQFENSNNIEFFENWKNQLENIDWYNSKIKHMPNEYYKDNFYLIGNKRQ
jgi:hypothetical protein